MKKLILMRHAKSDWNDPSLSDHDRPLNKRGRRSAPLMADKIESEGLLPEIVLASSAIRVQETLSLMNGTWACEPEVLTEPSLYLATVAEIMQHVHTLHESWTTAMVIGHNPGMGALVGDLAGSALDFPTAAVAVFEADTESWGNSLKKHEWKLLSFWLPRELE